MKTLYIFRHAKSDWGAEYESDCLRPLAKRGIKAAELMGRHLSIINQVPVLAISSSAKRAIDTFHLAKHRGNWKTQLKISDDLYLATEEIAIKKICREDDSINDLMLVGHEPMCSNLMVKCNNKPRLEKFPTATIARIDFMVERWADLVAYKGELKWLLKPRQLECHK